MRIGTILSLPDGYTKFARIKDEDGTSYTVEPGAIPKDTDVGDEYAYKVEVWGSDSGLVYSLKDD